MSEELKAIKTQDEALIKKLVNKDKTHIVKDFNRNTGVYELIPKPPVEPKKLIADPSRKELNEKHHAAKPKEELPAGAIKTQDEVQVSEMVNKKRTHQVLSHTHHFNGEKNISTWVIVPKPPKVDTKAVGPADPGKGEGKGEKEPEKDAGKGEGKAQGGRK